MIERLIEDIASGLGQWAYLLVAFMAMAETAAFLGFVAPGEFTIIFGGVLAGEGTLSIQLLIGIAWVSCVIGDAIGFHLGRRLGRDFVLQHGPRVRLTEERFSKVEEFFRRHGGKAIVHRALAGPGPAADAVHGRRIGHELPAVPALRRARRRPLERHLVPARLHLLAELRAGGQHGRARHDRVRDPAGAVRRRLPGDQAPAPSRAARALAAGSSGRRSGPLLRPVGSVGRAVWIAVRPVWRYVLRPLWVLVAPPLRFLVGRLTPGELGIELTTLVAIAGVCIYTVVLQIDLLQTDALLPGDETALDVARDIETGVLTTLADVLAVIGRLWFVVPVTAIACAFLLARRRAPEAIALSAGLAITADHDADDQGAVDRPRPGDGIVDADGFAYPSGHAALAVTYLAMAVVLSRAVPATWRVALVIAGIVLAVAIGLSRVYLRVHYLTDVVGGWAVGLAAFSLCGAVALIVEYLRHNSGPPAGAAPRRNGQPHSHLHHHRRGRPGRARLLRGADPRAGLDGLRAYLGAVCRRVPEHVRAGGLRRARASASALIASTTGTRSWTCSESRPCIGAARAPG